MKPPSQLLTFATTVTLGALGVIAPVGEAFAQSRFPSRSQTLVQNRVSPRRRPRIRFVKPKLSRDRGAPGKRSEGASRTYDYESENRLAPLTALVPRYVKAGQETQVLGQTTKSHPELAFYIPVAAEEIALVSLMLMDEAGNLLDEVAVEPPQAPGIVQVSLPESFAGLAEGERIQWYLEMELLDAAEDYAAEDMDNAKYRSVSGWVERKPMPEGVETALRLHGAADNAQIFASLGFWFDALELVADQRQSDPADEAAAADWAALMESVGLDALATAALTADVSSEASPEASPEALPEPFGR